MDVTRVAGVPYPRPVTRWPSVANRRRLGAAHPHQSTSAAGATAYSGTTGASSPRTSGFAWRPSGPRAFSPIPR